MRQLLVIGALVVCASGSTAAAAETAPQLEPGRRVRIYTLRPGPGPMTGAIEKLETSALVLRSGGKSVQVDLQNVKHLEISLGRVRRTRTGALCGAGVFLALVVSSVAGGGVAQSGITSPNTLLVGATMVGLGAAIGHQVQSDRWSAVPIGTR